MAGSYQYTPNIWTLLAAVIIVAGLSVYAWRRRTSTGAISFAVAMLCLTAWSLATTLEALGADEPTKFFWFKLGVIWQLPAVTAAFFFGLDIAGLQRWITRRTLALASIIPLLVAAMTLGDNPYLIAGLRYGDFVRATRAPLAWGATLYAYLLILAIQVIYIRLFFRATPRLRRQAAILFIAYTVTFIGNVVELWDPPWAASFDPSVVSFAVAGVLYAVGLFRFGLLDVVPVARSILIERMSDGMLVLDDRQRLVDINPAARSLIGAPAFGVIGAEAAGLLQHWPDVAALVGRNEAVQCDTSISSNGGTQYFSVHALPLADDEGRPLGQMILISNITGRRQAEAQLLQQQRALAMMAERELLARELHDSLSQYLAFVNVQTEAAQTQLQNGQQSQAAASLTRLASTAREMHSDLRDLIADLRVVIPPERGLIPTLGQMLSQFGLASGIRAELVAPDGARNVTVDPVVAVQLLRIVQEALTNARRHSGAHAVVVSVATASDGVAITISDDGIGFDPAGHVEDGDAGKTFGLKIMRERAAEIGGRLEIKSRPGHGTAITVTAPAPLPAATGPA